MTVGVDVVIPDGAGCPWRDVLAAVQTATTAVRFRFGALGLGGAVTPERVVAARRELDALRFAAEDAVDAEPLMPEEAQHEDVHAHGAALEEALYAAQVELDLLVARLREDVTCVS